jgi:hypothetical protein
MTSKADRIGTYICVVFAMTVMGRKKRRSKRSGGPKSGGVAPDG